MKVSKEFLGRVVTIQLARPLYIIDYWAHIKEAGHNDDLVGRPMFYPPEENEDPKKENEDPKKKPIPVSMDLLIGARVVEVLDGGITVVMLSPVGNRVRIGLIADFIMQVTSVEAFEPTDLPTVTSFLREPEPKPKPKSQIIL